MVTVYVTAYGRRDWQAEDPEECERGKHQSGAVRQAARADPERNLIRDPETGVSLRDNFPMWHPGFRQSNLEQS